MSRSTFCLAFVAAMLAGPASAAELRLEISNGLVTIVAADMPLRQILAEWAKVGGTRFVNAERVAGPPVTLQLQQVPEQEALAILLRSVAGYLAAPRRAGGSGASQYDSVMILATSTPPAAPTPTAAARGQVNSIIRPSPLQVDALEQRQVMPDDDGQIASDGFITVGSAPTPRQQTPAGTGPMGSAFPPGFPMPPGYRPPPGTPPPSPSTVQPGVRLPVGQPPDQPADPDPGREP
jgi:hypothetical protein